eukprot:TsM_000358800 transcript=TsM_000358800 gene=TsM_000358800
MNLDRQTPIVTKSIKTNCPNYAELSGALLTTALTLVTEEQCANSPITQDYISRKMGQLLRVRVELVELSGLIGLHTASFLQRLIDVTASIKELCPHGRSGDYLIEKSFISAVKGEVGFQTGAIDLEAI